MNGRDDPRSGREGTAEGRSQHPSTDVLLAVLADSTRRRVVWHVRDRGATPVDELVDVLAGWRLDDAPGGVVDADDRRRIATSLHHVHLPKLVDAGLVDYDAADDTVSPTVVDAGVEAIVAFTRDYDRTAPDREADE